MKDGVSEEMRRGMTDPGCHHMKSILYGAEAAFGEFDTLPKGQM